MSKDYQVIDVEVKIPDGYDIVRFGTPKIGETFAEHSFNGDFVRTNVAKHNTNYIDNYFILDRSSVQAGSLKRGEKFSFSKNGKSLTVINCESILDDNKHVIYFINDINDVYCVNKYVKVFKEPEDKVNIKTFPVSVKIPDGYEFVRYGAPSKGDYYCHYSDTSEFFYSETDCKVVILKRKEKTNLIQPHKLKKGDYFRFIEGGLKFRVLADDNEEHYYSDEEGNIKKFKESDYVFYVIKE